MLQNYITSALTKTLLVLAGTLFLSSIIFASERNYPFPRKHPVNVGEENYHQEYLSLQGLEGLFIDFESVESGLLKIGFDVPETFQDEVKKIVSDAGLEILDKETVRWSPGQPMLNIWPTFEAYGLDEGKGSSASPAGGVAAVGSAESADLLVTSDLSSSSGSSSDSDQHGECEIPASCKTSLWAGFSQSASLLRQPLREYRLSSWGMGDKSTSCEDRGEWAIESVKKIIGKFVEDYKKAQQEQMPAIVSRAAELPRNCAQSWMMIDGVFDLNESTLKPKADSILQQYVEFTADCNGFGYVVEAHDDSHADNQYNQILRTARAETVKEAMNSLGIHFKRVKIRKKNEAVPFMSGTLDAALLKGSVIIYPQPPLEFSNLDLDF